MVETEAASVGQLNWCRQQKTPLLNLLNDEESVKGHVKFIKNMNSCDDAPSQSQRPPQRASFALLPQNRHITTFSDSFRSILI